MGPRFAGLIFLFAALAFKIVGIDKLVKTLVQGLAVPTVPWPRMQAVFGRDLSYNSILFVVFYSSLRGHRLIMYFPSRIQSNPHGRRRLSEFLASP